MTSIICRVKRETKIKGCQKNTRTTRVFFRVWTIYRADESCACFHGAEASVADLQGQDLSTWGHTVALQFLWEVTCCNASYMRPMSPFKSAQASYTGEYIAVKLQSLLH